MATDILAPMSFPTPAFRRLQRGSPGSAPMPSLYQLDSAFQLQEYIAQLVKRDPEDIDHIVKLPGTGTTNANGNSNVGQQQSAESSLGQDVQEVDINCWIYEHLRRLAQDLTYPLITSLQEQCTRQTCPEMKAGEWLYLCVAHGNGGAMEQCCAIDYILHTLDSATSLLNSSRTFPSRIAIPATSTKHFSSLARRLSRIFAHAYFHHRELFEEAEATNALYERFLGLVREFDLVPAEYLVIDWEGRPTRRSRAYQQDSASRGAEAENDLDHSRQILSRNADQLRGRGDPSLSASSSDAALTASPSGRRRTDTMIMQGEMLAAWDDVIGGNIPFPENEAALQKAFDAGQDIAYEPLTASFSQDNNESEQVESVAVDPFSDDAEAIAVDHDTDLDAPAIKDTVVILGDDVNVPDVEDVVVPAAEIPSESAASGSDSGSESKDESWSEVELPTEPSTEGQAQETHVPETDPLSTVEEEKSEEAAVEGTGDAHEETATGNPDTEESRPAADVEVIEKMLSDLEIARNATIEAATAASAEPNESTTDAPSES